MKLSVLLATYNRQNDLEKTLDSISRNSRLPDEIIIIEQGALKKTKSLLKNYDLPLTCFYFEVPSLAQARNFGVQKCSGDLIFMFDDDVAIENDYLKKAETYFEKNPEVLGATGKQTNFVKSSFFNTCMSVLFNLQSFKKGNSVTFSGNNSAGVYDTSIRSVQWLQGFNMIYRKKALSKDSFPEPFLRWCFNEDVYASYKIYLKNPGSLRYLPQLKIKHFQSPAARLANYPLIRMKLVYRYFLWDELCAKWWKLPFLFWSYIGLLLIEIKNARSFSVLIPWLESLRFIIRYWNSMRTAPFNKFIFGET